MRINILTLFPSMFDGFLNESIIKRAIEDKLIEINIINIRDYALGKHKTCDDYSFGGGPGMLLKPEPLFRALRDQNRNFVIYTSPQGKTLNQTIVKELSEKDEITILAGRYEGIDERVIEEFVDMELSIGDYVLTGGELPAMVIADSVSRMIPNVIKKESFEEDSFFNGLLDHPHYTRPFEFEGKVVPEILISGNHEKIRLWRLKQSLKRTKRRRPDLLIGKELTKEEKKLLKEINNEE